MLRQERSRHGEDSSFATRFYQKNEAFTAVTEGERAFKKAVEFIHASMFSKAGPYYEEAALLYDRALTLFPVTGVEDNLNWSDLEDMLYYRRPVASAYQAYLGSAVACFQKAGWTEHEKRCMKRLEDFVSSFQTSAMEAIKRLEHGARLLNTAEHPRAMDEFLKAVVLFREAAIRSPSEEMVFNMMMTKYFEAYGWYVLSKGKQFLCCGNDAGAGQRFSTAGFLFLSASTHATKEKQYLLSHSRNCDAYAAVSRANVMAFHGDRERVISELEEAVGLWQEAHQLHQFSGYQVRATGIKEAIERIKASGILRRLVVS